MQVTINSISSPELLRCLQSIQVPKHRVEMLRKLAETGLGVLSTAPLVPAPQGRATDVRAAPQVLPRLTGAYEQPGQHSESRPGSANEADLGRANELPDPTTREQSAAPTPLAAAPLPTEAAVQATAGAVPPPFSTDLSAAMDRFF